MGLKTNIAAAVVGVTLLGGVGIATASTSSGSSVVGSASMTANPSTVAPATAAPSPSCLGQHDDGWPVSVDGRPAGLDSGDHGIYLWHDGTGWHLRITHANDNARLYTGEITTDGTLTAQPVRLEKDDHFVIGPKDHALAFAFVNYNGVDGLDFQTSCSQYLHFNFQVDGHEAPVTQVHIGEDNHNPPAVPFTVLRHS